VSVEEVDELQMGALDGGGLGVVSPNLTTGVPGGVLSVPRGGELLLKLCNPQFDLLPCSGFAKSQEGRGMNRPRAEGVVDGLPRGDCLGVFEGFARL